jgi:hypothetical protein
MVVSSSRARTFRDISPNSQWSNIASHKKEDLICITAKV